MSIAPIADRLQVRHHLRRGASLSISPPSFRGSVKASIQFRPASRVMAIEPCYIIFRLPAIMQEVHTETPSVIYPVRFSGYTTPDSA
jgi:hypothetical protein